MRETDVSKLNLNTLQDLFIRLTTVSNYRYSGHYRGYYRHRTRFEFEESVFISYLNQRYDLNISVDHTYYYSSCTVLKWDYNYVCNQLKSVSFSDFKDDFLKYYVKTEKTCYLHAQIFMVCFALCCLITIFWYLFFREFK